MLYLGPIDLQSVARYQMHLVADVRYGKESKLHADRRQYVRYWVHAVVHAETEGGPAARLVPCLLVPVERHSVKILATADAAANPSEFWTVR